MNSSYLIILLQSFAGRYREEEEVVHNSFNENLELDTVAYNTCINAMLEAG